MMFLIAYGMLTCFIILKISRLWVQVVLIIGAALLILLIGVSRIYLGVHYFSDVVAGFVMGSA